MAAVLYLGLGALAVSLVFIFMNYNRSAKERSRAYTPFYSEPGTKSPEQRRIEVNCNDIWKGIKTVQKIACIESVAELLRILRERQSQPYEITMGKKQRPLDEDDSVLIINDWYYVYEANPTKEDRYYRVQIGTVAEEKDEIIKSIFPH